jgi:hypothetical protein
MNAAEANTAFAVIANWRGSPLDDSERAAWKNRIWQWSATNFDTAINAWERSDKSHLRPTIGDLAALMPAPVRIPDEWEPPRPTAHERPADPEWVRAWFAEQRQKLGMTG